jgi:1-acyl-sn-glycerol-3-phosphate acyltransferase
MTSAIVYLWRLVRTLFGTAVFGLAVPLLALVAFPLASWQARSRRERQVRMQLVAHQGSRIFLRFVEQLGVMRLRGHRTELLLKPGPHLVVANHPTLIDVIALLAFMPQADCIVSGNRAGNWFLRGMVSACGYVSNDEGASVVAACARRLQEGRSLIIFPEGTRSPRGGLHRFRRGAAHIALAADCELLPVVIQCDPPTLGKNEKWYDVPDRTFTVTVTVIDPISTTLVEESGVGPPLAARRLTRQLRKALVKGLDIVDV